MFFYPINVEEDDIISDLESQWRLPKSIIGFSTWNFSLYITVEI